jgi:hypothetical protein
MGPSRTAMPRLSIRHGRLLWSRCTPKCTHTHRKRRPRSPCMHSNNRWRMQAGCPKYGWTGHRDHGRDSNTCVGGGETLTHRKTPKPFLLSSPTQTHNQLRQLPRQRPRWATQGVHRGAPCQAVHAHRWGRRGHAQPATALRQQLLRAGRMLQGLQASKVWGRLDRLGDAQAAAAPVGACQQGRGSTARPTTGATTRGLTGGGCAVAAASAARRVAAKGAGRGRWGHASACRRCSSTGRTSTHKVKPPRVSQRPWRQHCGHNLGPERVHEVALHVGVKAAAGRRRARTQQVCQAVPNAD